MVSLCPPFLGSQSPCHPSRGRVWGYWKEGGCPFPSPSSTHINQDLQPHINSVCICCVFCVCLYSGLPEQGLALKHWPAVPMAAARPPKAMAAVAPRAAWPAVLVTRCDGTVLPSPGSRLHDWRRNSTGRTMYPGLGDVSWQLP